MPDSRAGLYLLRGWESQAYEKVIDRISNWNSGRIIQQRPRLARVLLESQAALVMQAQHRRPSAGYPLCFLSKNKEPLQSSSHALGALEPLGVGQPRSCRKFSVLGTEGQWVLPGSRSADIKGHERVLDADRAQAFSLKQGVSGCLGDSV